MMSFFSFQAATATKEWTEQETLLLLEVREINNLKQEKYEN